MPSPTLTDRIRRLANHLLIPIGFQLKAWGVSPNLITVLGLAFVLAGAWQVSQGNFFIGAVIFTLGLPMDALDGATARAYGGPRPFGAFLDSTLDRYADAMIFGGLAIYYARSDELWLMGASLIALHGAMAVSYTRARAESLGVNCEIGLFSRLERVIISQVGLFASVLDPATVHASVILLAVGTQITALQRILYVAKQLPPQDAPQALEKEQN